MPKNFLTWAIGECINEIIKTTLDELCVSGAYVICSSAIGDTPVQIDKTDGVIEINGKYKLNEKDIALKGRFDGCIHEDTCMISESQIEDQEWKDTGIYRDTDNEQKTLNRESSYMICTYGPGIIYFADAGQSCSDFFEQISADELHLLKLVPLIKCLEIGDIYNEYNINYERIKGNIYITVQSVPDGYVTIGYGHAIQDNDEAALYGLTSVEGYKDFDFAAGYGYKEGDTDEIKQKKKEARDKKIAEFIEAYKAQYIDKELPGLALLSQETATLLLIEDMKKKYETTITAIGGTEQLINYSVDELNALTCGLYNGGDYTDSDNLDYHLIKSNGECTKAEALEIVEDGKEKGYYANQEGRYRRRLMEINIYYNGDYTFYDDNEIEALKEVVSKDD